MVIGSRVVLKASGLTGAYLVIAAALLAAGLVWGLEFSEVLRFTFVVLGTGALTSQLLLALGWTSRIGASTLAGLLAAQLIMILPAGAAKFELNSFVFFGMATLGWATLLGAVVYARYRVVAVSARSQDLNDSWLRTAMPAILFFFLFAVAYRLQQGLPPRATDSNGFELARTDALLFEVLSRGLATNGWGDSGIVADLPLRYHTLAYAWLGNLQSALNLDPFVLQMRLAPLLFALMLAWAGAFWAKGIRESNVDAFLAPPLLLFTGLVAAPMFTVIGPEVIRPFSLSSSFSGAAVAALTWALISRFRGSSRLVYALAGVGTFIVAGLKTSSGGVIVSVALGILLFSLRDRHLRARASWLFALSLIGFGVAQLLMTFGQRDEGAIPINRNLMGLLQGGSLTPSLALTTSLLIGLFVLPWIPRWSGLVGLLGTPHRLELFVAMTTATFAVGLLAVLDPSSHNRGWFPVAAVPVVSTLSAVGLGTIVTDQLRGIQAKQWAIPSLVAVAVFAWSTRWDLDGPDYLAPAIGAMLLATLAGLAANANAFRRQSFSSAFKSALKVGAVPLTCMSVMAFWLFPTLGSPKPSEGQRQESISTWQQLNVMAQDLQSRVEPDLVIVGDTKTSFALAGLLGARASASGSAYWGLGSKDLTRVGEQRLENLRRASTLDYADEDLLCTGPGPHLVVLSNEELGQWPEPILTTDDFSAWSIACRK